MLHTKWFIADFFHVPFPQSYFISDLQIEISWTLVIRSIFIEKICLDWSNDHCMFLFSSQAGVESKTTFDDLLESLKQLEEEPAGLIPVEESTEHKFGGWSKCLRYNLMIGGTQWGNVSKYIRCALNGFLYALEVSLVNLEQPNYLHVSVWMS